MRRRLFTLILLACPALALATIYKWVDENGVVHYSDQPHPNAEKVHLNAPQTYKAQSYTPSPDGPPADGAQHAPVTTQCAITAPEDEQTIENSDTVPVALQIDPAPSAATSVSIMLDGRAVATAAGQQQFTLTGVDRGQHSITGVVRDGTGRVLCTTAGVTVFVRQPSLQNPVSPVRPH
jgi:hypothetical protein